MSTRSRRRFVAEVAAAGAAVLAPRARGGRRCPRGPRRPGRIERIPLDGTWEFRLDAENDRRPRPLAPAPTRRLRAGHRLPCRTRGRSSRPRRSTTAWPGTGAGSRRRPEWQGSCVRVEFQAVFHSARVWVNGRPVGEHLRKGYTAFTIDITSALRWDGGPNVLVVRAENTFDDQMLPRGRSSDWTHDGGIYRPVTLIGSPPVFIERVAVDGVPGGPRGAASRRRRHPRGGDSPQLDEGVRRAAASATRSWIRNRAKRCCGSCGLARSASPRANR